MRPLLVLVFTFLVTQSARADDGVPASHSFERDFALAGYATGWEGAYLAGGLGGRARWEPFDWLGVETFAESLVVESPGGTRHDHPVGFNLFVPIDLGARWRVRPLFGFCAVFSFVEPENEGAPRADDVLFGVHGGAGVEWAPWADWSFFVDLQAVAYLGHDRTAQGWTGSVGEELETSAVAQLAAGIQLHL